jgi:hypothetical protein
MEKNSPLYLRIKINTIIIMSQHAHYHYQENQGNEMMMRAAATGSSVSSSSMPINFDFSRNVTLFRFQSNTGFEYFCVLLFTFTLAYVQEYIAFMRKKEEVVFGASVNASNSAYESLKDNNNTTNALPKDQHYSNARVLKTSAKYVAHASVSYILMLCVMSLNFGVLVSILLGLGVGSFTIGGGGGKHLYYHLRSRISSDVCHPVSS